MKVKVLLPAIFLTVGLSFFLLLLSNFQKLRNLSFQTKQQATLGIEDYLAQSTCDPPEGGCGMNHYWDFSSCSCVYDGGCTEPEGGCEPSYYWDSGSCSCEFYCPPPESGCGIDYYWDSESCSCTYYSQGGCTEPAGGCGTGYRWDSSKCECRVYDEGGGGWCTEPEGGCKPGNYWDSNSCSCVYSDSGGGCTEPSEGCGMNHYWDYNVCECVPYDNPPTASSPIEGEQCLISALGTKDYEDIYTGKRVPTYEEHLKFEQCFEHISYDSANYVTDDHSIPPATDDCLRSVLGSDLYEEVKLGRTDVPLDLRDKVDRCFGVDPHPFEEGKSYQIPDEVESCLLQAVGEDRYNQINSGVSEPTDLERQKGEACFGILNDDQVHFLPAPPEQVPYFASDPDVINFTNIFQDTKPFGEQIMGGKVVFSGKGPPNSVVTIYIYSEPIVVTTKTDDNGDWVYELNQPLSGEKHIAYATVRSDSGNIVRSSVFDFTVVAAEDDLSLQLLKESKVTRTVSNFVKYSLIITGLAGVFVIVGMGFIYAKKLNLAKGEAEGRSTSSDQRKSEGDTGPGSVN